MITILEILWIFWSVTAKLATIGAAGYMIDKIFNLLYALLDRNQNIVDAEVATA
tara:strand:- start:761 stop:922 length:162 start_codon:yes stop_codon:yes gene_type:complete